MTLTNLQIGAWNVYGGAGLPHSGKEYFVKKTTDTNYGDWATDVNRVYYSGDESVQTTITAAVAVADAGDTIWIYPGTWAEAAAVTVTQKSLKILGAAGGRNRALSETYWQQYGVGTDALIIDASNVEVGCMKFVESAGKSGIVVANGAGTGGVYIHDCYFYDVAQTGDYHIINGTTSYNAVGTMIEDCHFFKGKNLITVFGNRTTIRYCNFSIMSGCVGIQHTDARYGTFIVDNHFYAQGTVGSQQGIYFATVPPVDLYGGAVYMAGNHFVNFAAEVNCVNMENSVLLPYSSDNWWGNTQLTL